MPLPAQTSPKILLDETAIAKCLSRIAHEIVERNGSVDGLVLVGIRSRGVPMALRLAAQRMPIVGLLSLAAHEAPPAEAAHLSEHSLSVPEEPAPHRDIRRFPCKAEPRHAPELAELPQMPVSQLSIIGLGTALWAKHWLLPMPCCGTHRHPARRNMPRGKKISRPIWTRRGRIRSLLALAPSPTWAQGEARTRRPPLSPCKDRTLPQGTLHMPRLRAWGLSRLWVGSEDTTSRPHGPWGLESQDLRIKSTRR